MEQATLYMRAGCHWCGEAYEILRSAGYEVDEVSVEESAELYSRHGERVPVVVIDGELVSEGPGDLVNLPGRLALREAADPGGG